MKIALYTHCYFPTHVYGTEVYVAVMARELAALGHEPVVISAIFEGEQRQEHLIERYDWAGVPVVSIDKNAMPAKGFHETYEQPSMEAVHAQILREVKPDLVHVCHLINHTTAAIDAASALGIPLVATLTDFFGFCLNNRLEAADDTPCRGPNASRSNCMACHLKAAADQGGAGPLRRASGRSPLRSIAAPVLAASGKLLPGLKFGRLAPGDVVARPERLRRAMSGYRAAIAPSSFLRDAYEANGFPAPLHVVHFGLEIDRKPKPPSPAPDSVRLVFMGQIAPHKGLHVVLEAMRLAAAPNVQLTVWGDTGQDPAYMARLRGLAEGLPVSFPGRFPREQVAEVLAEADAALIPSLWYENSPQSLMEALATHTPVIVTDMPGLTEFVVHGRSGFVVPAGDAGAMASLFGTLSQNPALLAEMSQTTDYTRTPSDMAAETLAHYPVLNGRDEAAIRP